MRRVSGSSSSMIRIRVPTGVPSGVRHRKAGAVVLRPLGLEGLPGHEVVDGLGDVGGVVADALDVLGAEQEMRAERDVARVLHHISEELAEERGVERVDRTVALPDVEGLVDIPSVKASSTSFSCS